MLRSKIVMSNEVKAAMAETKKLAHEISSRGLPPHERTINRGGGGGFKSNSHFDVDEFMERQNALKNLLKQDKK